MLSPVTYSAQTHLLIYTITISLIAIIQALNVKTYYFQDIHNRHVHIKSNAAVGGLILLFLFWYVTFRPIDILFFDTLSYEWIFRTIEDKEFRPERDNYGFFYLTLFCKKVMNCTEYFGVLCLLYIIPPYIAFKKRFPTNYTIIYIAMVCAFGFHSYAVNGVKNGIATSLVILGMFYHEKKLIYLPLYIIAYSFHPSVMLPALVFIATRYITKPKLCTMVWFASIIFALILGPTIAANIGDTFFDEEGNKAFGYLSNVADSSRFSYIGFRWDFLLFSALPIAAGFYYTERYKYKDKLYTRIFNTYILCNAAWILVIYVPYTNRFAYLSWFLMAIVMCYPLVDKKFMPGQNQAISFLLIFLTLTSWIL